MSVSAEMYIVISLMFAVFAAVAAVGTSVVLGAGYERLRAGFEVVRRQTGFFADAIHKLDERTQLLDQETNALREGLSLTNEKVERVDKQTAFFSDAIHALETRQAPTPVKKEEAAVSKAEPLLPKDLDMAVLETMSFAGENKAPEEPMLEEQSIPMAAMPEDRIQQSPEERPEGLSHLLGRYFRGQNHEMEERTFH
jgi:hypothetical protein